MTESIPNGDLGGEAADSPNYLTIDHIAFAVRDLEKAIVLFRDTLGFKLINRRTVRGKSTGMVSAEMEYNNLNFVLCQGTEDNSQVSRLVSENGPGVAQIALSVEDVRDAAVKLQGRGLGFDTGVIEGPGLTQTFSTRCENTGLCLELVNRSSGKSGFEEKNVQALFEQLEKSNRF